MPEIPDTDNVRDIWVDYHLDPLPREQGMPLVPEYQERFGRWLAEVEREASRRAFLQGAAAMLDNGTSNIDNLVNPYDPPEEKPEIPTTEEIAEGYAWDDYYDEPSDEREAAFYRWLAEHDAQIRAEARGPYNDPFEGEYQ